MPRLIDLDKIKPLDFPSTEMDGLDVVRYLNTLPTVNAVEVVHGHWTATDVIIHQAGYGVRYYYHAECKVNPHRLFECENDYCPNCGAKMDGDNNGS